GSEGISALSFEEDGDRGEGLEDVEQLLVGGVVGEEVAEVDVAERGRRPRQRRAPAAADADVLRAVLRGEALPVEAVVERRPRPPPPPPGPPPRRFPLLHPHPPPPPPPP